MLLVLLIHVSFYLKYHTFADNVVLVECAAMLGIMVVILEEEIRTAYLFTLNEQGTGDASLSLREKFQLSWEFSKLHHVHVQIVGMASALWLLSCYWDGPFPFRRSKSPTTMGPSRCRSGNSWKKMSITHEDSKASASGARPGPFTVTRPFTTKALGRRVDVPRPCADGADLSLRHHLVQAFSEDSRATAVNHEYVVERRDKLLEGVFVGPLYIPVLLLTLYPRSGDNLFRSLTRSISRTQR